MYHCHSKRDAFFDLCSYFSSDLSTVQVPEAMDWEVVIQKLAKMILEEQTPQR